MAATDRSMINYFNNVENYIQNRFYGIKKPFPLDKYITYISYTVSQMCEDVELIKSKNCGCN